MHKSSEPFEVFLPVEIVTYSRDVQFDIIRKVIQQHYKEHSLPKKFGEKIYAYRYFSDFDGDEFMFFNTSGDFIGETDGNSFKETFLFPDSETAEMYAEAELELAQIAYRESGGHGVLIVRYEVFVAFEGLLQ